MTGRDSLDGFLDGSFSTVWVFLCLFYWDTMLDWLSTVRKKDFDSNSSMASIDDFIFGFVRHTYTDSLPVAEYLTVRLLYYPLPNIWRYTSPSAKA